MKNIQYRLLQFSKKFSVYLDFRIFDTYKRYELVIYLFFDSEYTNHSIQFRWKTRTKDEVM